MHERSLRAVLRRLVILGILCGCLVFFWSNRVVLAATCTECDNNLSTCYTNCRTAQTPCESIHTYDYCDAAASDCRTGCYNNYQTCLNDCTVDGSGGGGGGGGGCGLGRTVCERNCGIARNDCVAEGRGTCGQEYFSCMAACCP